MMTLASFHGTHPRLALALVLLTASGALAGDRFPPQTHIDQGPEFITPSTTADFVFRATVSGSTVPGAEFWCSLDEGEYLPCERTHRVEGLGVGPHVLLVYAHDPGSGLTDDFPAAWEWMVEEGAPPVDAGSPGGDGGTSGGQDAGPELDAGTSGDPDAGPGADAGTSGGQDAGTSTGSDAGTSGGQDAGSGGGSDSGTSGGQDAGTSTGSDAGTSGREDAGPGDIEDAGSPDGGAPDGGGDVPGDNSPPPEALDYLGGGVGCTGAPAPSAVAGLLLLVLAIRRRRRR